MVGFVWFVVGLSLSFSPPSDCISLPSMMTWASCPHGVRTRGTSRWAFPTCSPCTLHWSCLPTARQGLRAEHCRLRPRGKGKPAAVGQLGGRVFGVGLLQRSCCALAPSRKVSCGRKSARMTNTSRNGIGCIVFSPKSKSVLSKAYAPGSHFQSR